jgi:cyclopropane fatty-acyl-phospholipid synthase-like methyltransferase
MNRKRYLSIVSACETFFDKYGDNYLGVGWTKNEDSADVRYKVMLGLIKQDLGDKVTLLDFGCGASHLYEYILREKLENIEYSGLDLSEKFIDLSRNKFPTLPYYSLDVLEDRMMLPDFDYVVFNGVFTMKCDLSFDEMLEYFQAVVSRMFDKTRLGLAFNVMSKQVDWEREDLFHLPFDVLASFLTSSISRNFVIRHDYGLYEYTAYVYR